MPLQFGPTKIGGMQYNGVTIGEAMMDGQIVYRSIVIVTPLPPTFHGGEPWITLPDVEGVTYTVAGTPGPGQTVTVTATPQDGYQLEGVAVWEHEWPWPSGNWTVPIDGTNHIVYTFTAPYAGTYTATIDGVLEGNFLAAGQVGLFHRNALPSEGGRGVGHDDRNGPGPVSITTAVSLATNERIEFIAYATRGDALSGTWSITPA